MGHPGQIAERGMRAAGIEVIHPEGKFFLGVIEPEEKGLVQEFVPHAAIEALAKAVLHRFSRRDIVPCDAVLRSPAEVRVRGELRPIVRDDHPRFPPPFDQDAQFPRDPFPRDRRVGNRRETFARDVIDDVENPEPPSAGELILDEVERPARVAPDFDRHGRPTVKTHPTTGLTHIR